MKPNLQPASTPLVWTKASYSGNNGDCVEVAALSHSGRAVRDSKNPDGPALAFSGDRWAAFVGGVIAGEFD